MILNHSTHLFLWSLPSSWLRINMNYTFLSVHLLQSFNSRSSSDSSFLFMIYFGKMVFCILSITSISRFDDWSMRALFDHFDVRWYHSYPAVSKRSHLTTHFQCGGSTRHIDRHIHTSVVFFIRVRFWGNVFQIFAATKFRVDGTKGKKGTRHWCVLSIAGKSHTTSHTAVLEFVRTALCERGKKTVSEL